MLIAGCRARFGQADIHDFTTDILTGLFVKIESAGNTPEKVAENDYLMKCEQLRVVELVFSFPE